MTSPQNPVLSVVVAIVSDTTEARAGVGHLATCLEALSHQVDAPPMELIVPYPEHVDGIESLQKQFSHVTFVPVTDLKSSARKGGSREHHDMLRARGLLAAQGDLVALMEDHARPDENWCANIVAAHRVSYAAIGGAIENGIDRPLNWAVYYCDFGKYQNPLPAGESPFASDANISYKRSALESIQTTWEQSFREVIVNGTLMSRGEKVALQPDIIVYQHRSDLRLSQALYERFIWGRSYAATRNALLSPPKRMVYTALSPLLPGILLLRLTVTAWQRRRHFGQFVRALPLIAMLQTSWSLGEGVGYLTGIRSLPCGVPS
jgi:hypothetical protein